LLIDPHVSTDIVGAVIAGVVIVFQVLSRRAVPKPEIAAE
jgi:hypothetical protein